MEFFIEINGSRFEAQEGETLLATLARTGIKVPTLCHMEGFLPTGACRLCVVEIEGTPDLVSSCNIAVNEGMKVWTNTSRVTNARKLIVEALISNHPDDCLYCERNKNCELQDLADELGVNQRALQGKKRSFFPDKRSLSVFRDPAKCIICGRCVRVCEEVQYVNALDWVNKGSKTAIGISMGKGLNASTCINCGQCIITCPTGALADISHSEKVQVQLDNIKKKVVFVVSPVAVASMVQHFKVKDPVKAGLKVCATLKRLGASLVFDLSSAIEWNLKKEADELGLRVEEENNLPVFSSCCPSWVQFLQENYPGLSSRLASVLSPQQAFGKYLKTNFCEQQNWNVDDLFVVSVMPCVANKYEASLKVNTTNEYSQVDAVLTVRELIRMMRTRGLDFNSMPGEAFDDPLGESSSFVWKTGYSGGKAEAVARLLFDKENKNSDDFRFFIPKNKHPLRQTKVKVNKKNMVFAWVSGIKNAKCFLDNYLEQGVGGIDYLEVMACPDGCAGGGGQPVSRAKENVLIRKKVCQLMEKEYQRSVDLPTFDID